jgi:hypothetical protein
MALGRGSGPARRRRHDSRGGGGAGTNRGDGRRGRRRQQSRQEGGAEGRRHGIRGRGAWLGKEQGQGVFCKKIWEGRGPAGAKLQIPPPLSIAFGSRSGASNPSFYSLHKWIGFHPTRKKKQTCLDFDIAIRSSIIRPLVPLPAKSKRLPNQRLYIVLKIVHLP